MQNWPRLVVDDWRDVRDALHMRLQVVGKLTLSGASHQNHWWQAPLRLSPRGLRTPLLRADETIFEIEFDFLEHHVSVATPTGNRQIGLRSEPLSAFHRAVTTALSELGISLETLARPVEVPDPAIPFAEDSGHDAYDADVVGNFWRLLVSIDKVFDAFGSEFVGKASRPGLFWGAMDYAASRYSGRQAPPHPGGMPNVADWVMTEGYSHEVAAYGYFADGTTEGAFYAYTYPIPAGYRDQPMPGGVTWSEELGEWLLPYHLVRTANDPEATLLNFLRSAYNAAATTASWEVALQRVPPFEPGR